MCKIGISVGSEETNCQTTLLFYNHQWGDVFQSCCSTAITRKKSFSTKIKKKTGQLNMYSYIIFRLNCGFLFETDLINVY